MKPIIALIEGGYTGESVISERSANEIAKYIDTELFDFFRVSITNNSWVLKDYTGNLFPINRADFTAEINGKRIQFDGVFNMIHGTPGENGKIQAYFDLLNIPYTGGDVLNMALTFNKKATTTALGYRGFSVARSINLTSKNRLQASEQIIDTLKLPVFVKPVDAGSSLGITKVKKWEEFNQALDVAFQQSDEVMAEEMIIGTELSCGVIEYQGKTQALPVTEIVSPNEFFDFDAKYESDKTQEITPARISKDLFIRVQNTAVEVFEALNCKCFARIDFILQNQEPFIVEVNGIPGMSSRSIVPQQMQAAEIDVKAFVTESLLHILQK